MTVGVILPFILTLVGDYVIQMHTRDGKLAMYAVQHSREMTDQQLARAIGTSPFAVVRRAGQMTRAIPPIVALVSAILAACLEKRTPGKITALILTPYFLWDFSMSAFSIVRTPSQAVFEAARVLGTNAMYIAVAAVVAIAVARLLAQGRFSRPHTISVRGLGL